MSLNELNNNIPALPVKPPDCISNQELLGERCADCPILGDCQYQAIGQRMLFLTEQADVANQSAEKARWDNVVTDFLTRDGLDHVLLTDTELWGDLVDGEAGVLRFDIRGLTFVNNKIGHHDGDLLLKIAANRIAKAVRSGRNSNYRDEDRRSNTPEKDIVLVRPSGDEFEVIMRDISGRDFLQAAARVARGFTVNKAIQDDQAGRVPIISSLGLCHAGSSRTMQESIHDNVHRGYELLSKSADLSGVASRRSQYRDMWWERAVKKNPSLANYPLEPHEDTPSKDVVIKYFLGLWCPNFIENPRQTLERGMADENVR
jgi:GGDEF domain-containing protein